MAVASTSIRKAVQDAVTSLERRHEPRHCGHGEVWLINHYGRTVLRCQCVDVSATGMRLHVPPGYGLAPRQRYELHWLTTGSDPTPAFQARKGRSAHVVWSRRCQAHHATFVDVGLEFDGN